jgi:hypothetical protein
MSRRARALAALIVVIVVGARGAGAKEQRMVRVIGRVVACEIHDVSKTVEAKNARIRLTITVEESEGDAGPVAGSELELVGSGKLAVACVPVGERVSVKAQLNAPPVPSRLYELTRL